MRTQVRSLALLSGLKIRRCHELRCRLQTRLGSCIAVAIALIGPLAWEPPYALVVALKKQIDTHTHTHTHTQKDIVMNIP